MVRLRTPDRLAGLFGLALLVSLAGAGLGLGGLWLALTGLLAVGVLVVTATKDAPALPVAFDVLTVWAAIVAVPIAVVRLLGDDTGWGEILGAAAVAGVLASAWWAMRKQDQPGLRPPPEVRAMPVPPAQDPAA